MEPLFKPRRLGHVNFWVDDADAAARWHYDVAGLNEAYRRVDIKGVFLSNGNTYHDSAVFDVHTKFGAGRKPGMHHIAFELENEVELVEGYKRCADYGFEFDLMLSADIAHCCYGVDPDGNRFEVYTDVVENWRERRNGNIDEGGQNPRWTPGSTPPVAKSCYPVDPPIERIEDAALHTKRASHAVLVAKDYDAMVRHYTRFVGLTPLAGGANTPFCILGGSLGEQSLAIFAPIDGVETGCHHGSFELADDTDFDTVRERLAARGIAPERETNHPVRRGLYLRDPSGNLINYFVAGNAPVTALADMTPQEALWVA